MSKSKGNTISPDGYIERYGADAVRLYLLFIGPVEQDAEWQDAGLEGIVRFLHRLWRAVMEQAAKEGGEPPAEPTQLLRKTHATIAKVTDDIGRRLREHTPIMLVMELVNELVKAPDDPAARFAAETAVSLIHPYAPHIAEELWEGLGNSRLWEEPWPAASPELLQRETFELVVQVNGKVRDRLEVPVDLPEEVVEQALASPRVQALLDGGEVRRTVVVPQKLVNVVIS